MRPILVLGIAALSALNVAVLVAAPRSSCPAPSPRSLETLLAPCQALASYGPGVPGTAEPFDPYAPAMPLPAPRPRPDPDGPAVAAAPTPLDVDSTGSVRTLAR